MTYSIIIPTMNNSKRLQECLVAIKKQIQKLRDVEIIVVDNGSTEDNLSLARQYTSLVFEYHQSKSPYPCRNLGVRKATGEYFIFLDSSCIPCEGWFEHIISFFNKQDSKDKVLLGQIVFELDAYSTNAEIADSLLFCDASVAASQNRVLGGMFVVRRTDFLKVGFFSEDVRSGADTHWGQRAHAMGLTIQYKNEVMVKYLPKKKKQLLEKAQRVGKGLYYFDRKDNQLSIFAKVTQLKNTFFPPSFRFSKKIPVHLRKNLTWLDFILVWLITYRVRMIKGLGRLGVL